MSGTPSPWKSATVGAPPAPLASATGPHRAWPRWSISQTLPAWTTTISGCGSPLKFAIAVVGRRAAQDLLACAAGIEIARIGATFMMAACQRRFERAGMGVDLVAQQDLGVAVSVDVGDRHRNRYGPRHLPSDLARRGQHDDAAGVLDANDLRLPVAVQIGQCQAGLGNHPAKQGGRYGQHLLARRAVDGVKGR